MLYYLEGRTRDEAARQLGASKAVFRRRLEYGRARLGRQLAWRGITLSAAMSALLLADAAAQAALPPLLIANTVRAGLAAATGNTIGGIVSAQGHYRSISFAPADEKLGLSVESVSFTVGGWNIKVEGHRYRRIDPDADTKLLKCDLLFQPAGQ